MALLSIENKRKINQYLPQLILLLGALLRLKIYFENRSLFIDEGALASEIVGKSFGQLFEPLHFQFSPPLYSVLVKWSTQLLGANEYALRLNALIAGLLTLYVFYRLLKKNLDGIALFYPLGLIAFGLPFIQYSSECKQYSIDVLVTTVLLYLFFKYQKEQERAEFTASALIIGVFAIWLSMPIVFVLAGLGSYVFLQAVINKNGTQLVRSVIMIGAWLVSFAVYYFTILSKDAEIGSLVSYHQEYFFPLIPTSTAEFFRGLGLLLNVLRTGVGATVIALLPALVFLGAGIYSFWKKEKLLCLALCLPIFLCLITSGLGLYSLISRMTLFLMPILFLFLGTGMALILEKIGKRFELFFWGIALVSWINLNGFQFFTNPYQIEEIRPVLAYVHDRQQSNESAFVHHIGMTAYRFYQYHHEDKNLYELDRVKEMDWREELDVLVQQQALPCWVVLSHLNPEEQTTVLQQFEQVGQVTDIFQTKNAGAWLFAEKE